MDETIPPGPDDTLDTLGPIATMGTRNLPRLPGAVAGLSLTLGLHLLLAALLLGLHALPHTSAADLLAERAEEEPPQLAAISTKLVKLGKQRRRRDMPDKILRNVSAAAPDAPPPGSQADIAIARSGKAPQKQEKAPEKVSAQDLAKALERAKILAQVGDARETATEGSPEGVRDGEISPDEARPLDLYVTLLHRMIRQRWSTAGIPPDELRGLRCSLSVQFQRDLTVGAVRVARSSGHSGFDQTALEAVQRFRNEVGTIPPPPDEEVAEQVFSRPITIRFQEVVR